MSINTNYSTSTTSAAASTSGTSSSSTTSSSDSGLDPTFMTLLLAELKSQDPTSPMDTTAMVGQMVSLNQLNELISIQNILQNSLGTQTTESTTQSTNGVN